MKALAKNLKILRIEKNLTQQKLAQELHVGEDAVSGWERNKQNPTLEMLVKIANYFDVSIDYLLDNE